MSAPEFAINCVECGAQPGEPCVSSNGSGRVIRNSHKSRRRRAPVVKALKMEAGAREVLRRAGKLAAAAGLVVKCDTMRDLSTLISGLEEARISYNEAFEDLMEGENT